ncbi:MAG: glycosyltransferase family 2 protein [Candidatus Omnitrophota bacterium]
MTFIFWISAVALFYTYLGYPLFLALHAKLSADKVKKDMAHKPNISVIISAYNEEDHIEQKIENLLRSDYPPEKFEILVGSDGSNDKTAEILSHLSKNKVKVFVFPDRRGKPSVLNDLVGKAGGDVLVFCDARQLFDKNAISQLAANFADDKVGCVSGELVFEKSDSDNGVSEGVGFYWNYEKMMRKSESAVHSMIGATGAIYAIRRKLYTPLPKDTILDDVATPLAIVRQGYRSVWDEEARAYDKPAFTPEEEYRRKVRTLAGNYQAFSLFRDLLVPCKSPVAIYFISHKLLRVLAPFFMISLFVSNLFISGQYPYSFFFICQIIFYVLAILGSFTYETKRKRLIAKIASTAYMFCLLNFTAIAGLHRFITGKQNIAWEKSK